jgi:glucose/mannose-6-phosphate isomerase
VVDASRVDVLDRDGMGEAISGLAGQLVAGDEIGAAAAAGVTLPSAVVIAGMGGSAMGGELLRALVASDCPVPMTGVRGFDIPVWARPGTLAVLVSYSGDTAETLECARQAHRQGASLLCVGSGGELGRLAAEWDAPFARVPGGLQPRAALGYLFGALAGAFGRIGLCAPRIAVEGAAGVDAVDRDAAAALGERLAPTVPLVYGAGALAAVAYRWKTQFNENAKMHAFSHAFPEFDHNEIVGWEGAVPGRFSAVILRDTGDRPDTVRRIDAAVDLIRDDAAVVEVVDARGETPAARALNALAYGDWASYAAALARDVDPTPVERIQAFKRLVA